MRIEEEERLTIEEESVCVVSSSIVSCIDSPAGVTPAAPAASGCLALAQTCRVNSHDCGVEAQLVRVATVVLVGR